MSKAPDHVYHVSEGNPGLLHSDSQVIHSTTSTNVGRGFDFWFAPFIALFHSGLSVSQSHCRLQRASDSVSHSRLAGHVDSHTSKTTGYSYPLIS